MAKAVRWDLIADPKGFQRGFREANRSADTFSRGIKRTAGLIGGAFAGIQVAGFLKDAILEAREAAKVTRQTNAVIKATGGVANVSAKDVDRLANSLSAKVGVDDEVIAAGANMLLTFKGVRSEVGKGNDIFQQASKVALDMTAALNQGEVSQSGLEQSTIRLGKALQDPIKGVSALTRVGVTFTDSQKEQIKTLVESGDTMAAQKIILGELKTEFGGAAAAAADPWQRLVVVLGNVKEEIGTALLPAFEAVADWLSVFLPKAIDRTKAALRDAREWWDRNKESVKVLASILVDTFVPASNESEDAIKDFAVSLGTLANFLTDVTVFTLELIKVWLSLEHVTIGLISVYGSLQMAAGHLVNAIDKLSGGTGHAGDQFVKMGQKAKDQATRELKEVRKAAINAQAAIDRLHGKDVKISGTTSLQFTKSFSQKDWLSARLAAGRIATGGPIHGPGTEMSDSIPMWLSKGEHVWSAREVKGAGGHAAMEAMRTQARGLALGGKVDQTGTAHTGVGKLMDRWGTLIQAAGIKQAMSLFGGALGGGSGGGGWQWQMRALRQQFPGLALISGFRPGAITATGNRSYHSMGRAVDIPPRMDVFNWIRGTYGKNTRELIFSPAGNRQVHNGADHYYTGVTRGDHWSHVHWAYDKGGFLPPGTSIATNTTGKAEAVGFDYERMADAFVAALEARPPTVYLDRQKVSRAVRNGDLWESRR